MKKALIICFVFLCVSLSAKSQATQVCQPDSATIYFDMSTNPQWYYGGVWNFQCTYDANGLLEAMSNGVTLDDDCIYRGYHYSYDMNHNTTHTEYTGYDCSGPGVQYKTENVFQHNLIKSQTKYVNSAHKQWAFADSTSFHYDKHDRLETKESFNAERVHTSTVHYKYTDQEKVITTEKLDNNLWKPVKRETQTYSTTDNLLNLMTETYNDGAFHNSTLITYSYDEQNHCTSVLTQKWENESWENVKMVINGYNDNGHLTVAKLMQWQEETFVDANRAVYELNEDGYPTAVFFEKWNEDDWVEGTWVSDFHVYSENHLNRQNKELCQTDVRRIEIHYANTPMPDYDVEEHPTEQAFATIHPNPTTGLVIITGKALKQAEVLNTLGQCVATTQGQGETLQINIANLPTGVYFVRVMDEEGRKCIRKVVKE